jgi:hypothetical protein
MKELSEDATAIDDLLKSNVISCIILLDNDNFCFHFNFRKNVYNYKMYGTFNSKIMAICKTTSKTRPWQSKFFRLATPTTKQPPTTESWPPPQCSSFLKQRWDFVYVFYMCSHYFILRNLVYSTLFIIAFIGTACLHMNFS